MNKYLLGFLLLGAGFPAFLAARGSTGRARVDRASRAREWRAAEQLLGSSDRLAAALRDEGREKKRQLRLVSSSPRLSDELLRFLESDNAAPNSRVWSELRERFGISWNSSPDFVLVNKGVLKQLDLHAIVAHHATEELSDVLAMSPDERAGVNEAIKGVSIQLWSHVRQAGPSGDILAQFTIPADPNLQQSISNSFSAAVVGTLGPERAGVFLNDGWRSMAGEFYPIGQQTIAMTFKSADVDGQPALNFQWTAGSESHQDEVQYARYPSGWFFSVFPGGWPDAAQRGGFQLPQRSLYHP